MTPGEWRKSCTGGPHGYSLSHGYCGLQGPIARSAVDRQVEHSQKSTVASVRKVLRRMQAGPGESFDIVRDRRLWQGERERAACPGLALHPDRAAVQLDECLRQRQPQPGPL